MLCDVIIGNTVQFEQHYIYYLRQFGNFILLLFTCSDTKYDQEGLKSVGQLSYTSVPVEKILRIITTTLILVPLFG